MAKFFIDRPVFAWVIAIVLMMAGALSILKLPVSQYPNIAPPAIGIAVTYPGASAQTVQDTVVQVIEQQMNGLDGLEYISSESNSDGSMSITLTFRQGTNPDTAQVQVQNKLSLAQPLLPQEVQQQGIRVTKATKNFLIVAGFVSTDGTMTKDDLADYVASYVQDPISRTQGVGDFQLFGSQYAMRIWLDPAKLVNYGLTTVDVVDAIKEQNVQVSSGQLGGLPAVRGQQLNATIIGPSRLERPEDFGRILLKVNTDGSQVRLANVARIELGGQTYAIDSYYNGKPASGLAIKLAPGANALDTAQAVRDTINNLKPYFPPGMDVVYPYDTTPFVSLSIEEVFKTLVEAIILVFLVMYLFLQNFRATLIPTLAVPVVLLGTFGVLAAFGYSINTLTMFGMVLAIGLLVDNAIVVVENVERVMAEEGLTPKQATRKSMTQITGALIGIAMVLGVVVGYFCNKYAQNAQEAKDIASYFSLITDIFLRMIKMIIAPLVFATLVSGLASMSDASAVGRIGLRAMFWFIAASAISLLLGLALVNIFQPGAHLNLALPDAAATAGLKTGDFTLKAFIAHVFPKSIAEAMANNEILQILVFSLFFGAALSFIRGKGHNTIYNMIDELAKIMFRVTDYVMRFAPLGVFAAMAAAITTEGLGVLVSYGKLIGEFYLGLALLWTILFAVGYLFLGKSTFRLGGLIKEPTLLAFSTASSESAYPKTIEALERFGVSKRISGFVLPLGYSFNLDGSMMYQSFAVLFIAQAYNIEMSFSQQLTLLLVLMVTSKGMAGVARASLVVVAATLPMFHLPEAGLLLIMGIDQFFDMGRTATNVVGNSLATAVIAKMEGNEEDLAPKAESAPATQTATRDA